MKSMDAFQLTEFRLMYFISGILCSSVLIAVVPNVVSWYWLTFALAVLTLAIMVFDVFTIAGKSSLKSFSFVTTIRLFSGLSTASMRSFIFGLFCSFLLNCWHLYNYDSQNKLLPGKRTIEVVGYICDIPTPVASQSTTKVSAYKVDFCVTESPADDIHGVLRWTNLKVKLNWRGFDKDPIPEPMAGQLWELQIRITPPHSLDNPGGFDYQRWLVANHYWATGYVKSWSDHSQQELSKQLSIKNKISVHWLLWRQSRKNQLVSMMPESPQRAMLLALAIGYRGELSDSQWKASSESGTAHLLAISGLHIGLAALWGYWLFLFVGRLLTRLNVSWAAYRLASIGALLSATLVAAISGFGLPAIRALTMLSIVLLLKWTGYRISLMRSLLITAAVILLFDPFAVLNNGFWLSFSAVAIISWLMVSKNHITENQSWHKLLNWSFFNFKLYMGLLPLSLLIFGFISGAGWLANWILIPLTSFISLPLALGAVLTIDWFPSLSEKLLEISQQVLLLTQWLQQQFSGSSWLLLSPADKIQQLLFLVPLVLAVVVLLMPKGLIRRATKIFFLLTSILSGFSFVNESERPLTGSNNIGEKRNFSLTVFDIGQGLSVLIEVDNKNLLFDTGYGNNDFSYAERVLQPFLDRKRINSLDMLITSHGDADHAGGADYIINNLAVSEWLSGEPERESVILRDTATKAATTATTVNRAPKNCHHKMRWQWGTTRFHFLANKNGKMKKHIKSNNRSCVLVVDTGKHQFLLTGDIEANRERELVSQISGPITVLLAPHHGSNTSSSQEFINAAAPQWVIFSTGFLNQWHFPRPEVISRYETFGSKLHNTATDGYFSFIESSDGRYWIARGSDHWPHFWQSNQSQIR